METRNRRKRTIRLDHIPPAKPSKADRLLSEVQPAFEVDASSIEMKEIINEGGFGKVYRAVLKRKGRKDLVVALKQLFTNGNREMDDLRYHKYHCALLLMPPHDNVPFRSGQSSQYYAKQPANAIM